MEMRIQSENCPYMIEIMKAFDPDEPVREITIIKGCSVGISTGAIATYEWSPRLNPIAEAVRAIHA